MGQLEAHTTHTVKLSWDPGDPLDKSVLIRGLSDTLPDGALVIGLSVADISLEDPHEITQVAKRTLTITYCDDPIRTHYRRP